jgi:hypothetical protein
VDSVHASWTTASGRSTVDPTRRGWEITGERLGQCSGLPVLTDGGQEGEGRCGGHTTGLTGARGAVERLGG